MKCNRAVFTIVQNEPMFLPLWLQYYGRYFSKADIYVLDHDSTDGSVLSAWKEYRPNVVPVHRAESFNHAWLRDTVQAFQRFLLQSYQNVLFAEIDEIVVANPLYYPKGLSQYIEQNDRPVVRCVGYNLQQQPDEKPVDWQRPILAQRSVMWLSRLYSKPLLCQVPVLWSLGFHFLEGGQDHLIPTDRNLMLLHLHRIDYMYCLRRHEESAKRNWSKKDVEEGFGLQNRICNPEEFHIWYTTEQLGEQRLFIPDYLKEVF